MKKIFFFLIISLAFFGVACATAAGPDVGSFAQGVAQKAGYTTTGVTDTTLSKTVGGIISAILGLVGVIFLVLTVYAGFLWMTASGNEDKVSQAKKILSSSIIGLIIVASAYGITALVMRFVFNASAPDSSHVGSTEDFVDLKQGCCVQEVSGVGTPKCWEFDTADRCATLGDWYSDTDCSGGLVSNYGISCVMQN